ncbi:MAG: winged helix-turn-helix transcriptional regulator [Blautia sp.]|nr:winged helix-turn-helix transcriptional regulator [Blautia sp.]
MPEGLTLEEFYEGKSKPVNLELQRIMAQLDYIEQTGHGVPLIVFRYGKDVFDITENFVTVTIPLNKKEIQEEKMAETGKELLDEQDEKILELMGQNSKIKVSEISALVGLGMTTVTKRIRILREKGFVQRAGSKKTGQWSVRGRQE